MIVIIRHTADQRLKRRCVYIILGCPSSTKGEEHLLYEQCWTGAAFPFLLLFLMSMHLYLHFRMKYWSCCKRKTSDFNSFLSQEGCNKGSHQWRTDTVSCGIRHIRSGWCDVQRFSDVWCFFPCRVRKWLHVDLIGTRQEVMWPCPSMQRTRTLSSVLWKRTAPRWVYMCFYFEVCSRLLFLVALSRDIVYYFSVIVLFDEWCVMYLQLKIHLNFEGDKEFELKMNLWGVSIINHHLSAGKQYYIYIFEYLEFFKF